MTGPPPPRTHYVGDGCEPAHYLTVLAPEDPEDVRKRDRVHKPTKSKRPKSGLPDENTGD